MQEDTELLARPDGRRVCDEYRPALERVCAAPALMCTSALREHISELLRGGGGGGSASAVASPPPPVTDEALDAVVVDLVLAAFPGPARTADDARRLVARTPVEGGEGRLHAGAMSYLRALAWEQPVLLAALRALLCAPGEAGDGAGIVLGLMVRASRECAARRRATFSCIVLRATSGSRCGGARRPPLGAVLAGAPPHVVDAARRVASAAVDVLDELKDLALQVRASCVCARAIAVAYLLACVNACADMSAFDWVCVRVVCTCAWCLLRVRASL
jgi:hypothetical protein